MPLLSDPPTVEGRAGAGATSESSHQMKNGILCIQNFLHYIYKYHHSDYFEYFHEENNKNIRSTVSL